MDAGTPLQEILRRRISGVKENKVHEARKSYIEQYLDMLNESARREENQDGEMVDYVGKTDIVNEGLRQSIEGLKKLSEQFNKDFYGDDEEEAIDE